MKWRDYHFLLFQEPPAVVEAIATTASAVEATTSTSVTVSSLSRPSSSSSSQCFGPAVTSNNLSRGSPLSKSLKHPYPSSSSKEASALSATTEDARLLRRSVPNVLEESTPSMIQRLQQQTDAGSSSSTIVPGSSTALASAQAELANDKDALLLKWETAMGAKYTIVVSSLSPREPQISIFTRATFPFQKRNRSSFSSIHSIFHELMVRGQLKLRIIYKHIVVSY